MKVVLLKDLKNKGKKGDIVSVNNGYAANFLIPNGYAVVGNNTNVNEANQAKAKEEYQAQKIYDEALELSKSMKDIIVCVKIKCGENGKIFGSVTSKEIAEELNRMGYNIDKKKIELDNIKNVGSYSVSIKLHSKVSTTILLNVIPE